MRRNHRLCRIVFSHNDLIARPHVYLDSAMVTRLFEENPIIGLLLPPPRCGLAFAARRDFPANCASHTRCTRNLRERST